MREFMGQRIAFGRELLAEREHEDTVNRILRDEHNAKDYR